MRNNNNPEEKTNKKKNMEKNSLNDKNEDIMTWM